MCECHGKALLLRGNALLLRGNALLLCVNAVGMTYFTWVCLISMCETCSRYPVFLHTYVHACMYMQTCMRTNIDVLSLCVCVYIYIYTHTHLISFSIPQVSYMNLSLIQDSIPDIRHTYTRFGQVGGIRAVFSRGLLPPLRHVARIRYSAHIHTVYVDRNAP